MKLQKTFTVTVFSPFETYFEGPALAVSAETEQGPFDVLFGHANFLSLLVPCKVTVRTAQGQKEIPITRGILQVANNAVWLFANV